MKWVKHMTNAHRDEKLQRLIDEFGLEGYGAYWIILEILGEQIKDSDRDFCEYSMKFWQNSLGFSVKKLQNFLEILSKFEIFLVEFSQNSVIIKCPKIKTIRDEYTEKKTQKIGTLSRQTPDTYKDTDKDTEQEEVKAKASTSTPDPQKLQQQIFENSQPIKQTGGETEQGLDLILIRPDKTKQNEVEWLMQNLIHHVRSGRNGKTQLHDGSLAGFVGVHPEAKKLLYEWKRHGPAERMAAIALAANSPTATNELKYALAAIKNRYDGYVSNLKTTETAIASGDKEIEL